MQIATKTALLVRKTNVLLANNRSGKHSLDQDTRKSDTARFAPLLQRESIRTHQSLHCNVLAVVLDHCHPYTRLNRISREALAVRLPLGLSATDYHRLISQALLKMLYLAQSRGGSSVVQGQAELASHPRHEQRQSHRFPVVGDRRGSLIEFNGQLAQARVVNESATGLRVIVPGSPNLIASTVVRIYLDELWIPVEVIRAEIDGEETIIGLRRLEVMLIPAASKTFGVRFHGVLRSNLSFYLTTAALLAVVAAVLLMPTPDLAGSRNRAPTDWVTGRPGGSRPAIVARPSSRIPSLPSIPLGLSRRPRELASPPPVAGKVKTASGQDATKPENDDQAAELAILNDPLVAEELEISEEQRRLLGAIQRQTPHSELPRAVLEVLTPHQRERWKQRRPNLSSEP